MTDNLPDRIKRVRAHFTGMRKHASDCPCSDCTDYRASALADFDAIVANRFEWEMNAGLQRQRAEAAERKLTEAQKDTAALREVVTYIHGYGLTQKGEYRAGILGLFAKKIDAALADAAKGEKDG